MVQRFIIKPAPLTAGDKPYGLAHFIFWLVENDALFSQNGEGLRSRLRVERAVTEQKDATFLTLSEPDWRRLQAAAENPSTKTYPVSPAAACVPFLEALRLATTEAPSPAAPAPKRKKKAEATS
jgi:hypothetical protein